MRPFVPAFFADLFCNRLFVFLLQLHLQRGITVRTAVTDLAVQRYIQLASRNALVVGAADAGICTYFMMTGTLERQLRQWPVQIKLVPVNAPYFDGANLLIAADCTAYAYANFHQDFIRGKVTLVGCPKLDDVDYSEKLTEILRQNNIKSVTVVRMEVPCCGGLEYAVRTALQNCGKLLPWQVKTISIKGELLDD